MTRFRRKSAALNLVRIIPVWHPQSDRPRQRLCPCTPRGASCPSTPYFYIIIMRRRSRLRPLSSALLLKSMTLISLNPRRVKMRELGDGSERRRGESNISAFSRRKHGVPAERIFGGVNIGVPAKYHSTARTLCGVNDSDEPTAARRKATSTAQIATKKREGATPSQGGGMEKLPI